MDFLLESSVVVIVFTLGVLILVHELGHFLVGRLFGMAVESFSIGFGPALASFRHKGTRYRLGLIPLGGYVQFVGAQQGDEVPEIFRGGEIFRKPLWQRACMTLAGPVANLLLAMVAFGCIAYIGTSQHPSIVGLVEHGSAAHQAGLRSGDRITAVAGEPVRLWPEISSKLEGWAGREVTLDVEREGQRLYLKATPLEEEGRARLGIMYGFLPALIRVEEGSIGQRAGLAQASKIAAVAVEGEPAQAVSSFGEMQEIIGTEALRWERFRTFRLSFYPASAEEEAASEAPAPITLQLADDHRRSLLSESSSSNEVGEGVLTAWGISSSLLMVLGAVEGEDQEALPLMRGDIITAVAGTKVNDLFSWHRMIHETRTSPRLTVEVERAGEVIEFELQQLPQRVQEAEGARTYYRFPASVTGQLIAPPATVHREDFLGSVTTGVRVALQRSGDIAASLWGLVRGSVPLAALGGPILIAKVARDSAARGIVHYLNILALISLNLFLINLVPIPVLDGGQLVLLACEAIKGSRLSTSFIENYQKIGLVMVLSLVLLTTYNDLSRFWVNILQSLGLGVG